MTTPSPDKIEIPDAAVEAACWAHAPQWGGMDETIKTYARQQMRAALTAARSYIPHMPDRGYAEGIEAAAKSIDKRLHDYVEEHGNYDPDTGATEFPGNGDEYCAELEEIAEAIRALAPLAPADNGALPLAETPVDYVMKYGGQCHDCADHDGTCPYTMLPCDPTKARQVVRYVLDVARYGIARGLLAPFVATPSPIEEVAGPSEVEIEDAYQEGYNEGYEEGKSEWKSVKAQLWNAMQQWLTLRHGLADTTGEGYTVSDLLDGLAEVEAENKRLLLAARRVRPSPVDEDARDGVLEEAANAAYSSPHYVGPGGSPGSPYDRGQFDAAKAIRALKHGGQE